MPFLRTAWPGVALALAIGLAATVVGREVPVVGGPVPAVVLGALVGWLVRRRRHHDGTGAGSGGDLGLLQPGVKFASSRVLQFAVVLLGAQLSIAEVLRIGGETLPVMLTTLVVCLVAAWGSVGCSGSRVPSARSSASGRGSAAPRRSRPSRP
ncbi:putative sulfate exporter family transporter [Curtobacterium sp. YR515]|uniref:putative sulfate exporter family transporter n=1 Tax=Curtobacterium sp. YR515 TaxID=1855316 RepID=UPI0020C96E52|nr:putative sulfate exporter family transporter [Curtobacterium sp. YR515]